MLINNAVRRAVMQSRRFKKLETSAPLPLGTSSSPIALGVDGLKTFDKTFTANFGDINEWTNGVSPVVRNFVFEMNNDRVRVEVMGFGDQEHFDKLRNKDLVQIYTYEREVEFIVLKYEKTVDEYWDDDAIPGWELVPDHHIYVKQYPYMRPTNDPMRLVADIATFAGTEHNNDIMYYFYPQHTIKSLWEDILPLVNADAPLSEQLLCDPILVNLIRLELKKSVYEFIDDTTEVIRMDTYQEEIDAEVQRVKITVNTIPSEATLPKVNPLSVSPINFL